MAILSNINGKFAVENTGAIKFSNQTGTSGQILKSNGNAAPTWVAASTVIGGPYLPLSGGTLTGATATASGISFTVGGVLTGTTASFNAGATNVVATFTSTDGIAGIALVDSSGNVELSASGNTFQVQPAGGAAALTVSSTNATFSGNVTANGYLTSNGSFTTSSFWGTLITAGAGSYADFALLDSGTTRIMHVPTGTRNVVFESRVGIGTTSPDRLLEISHDLTSHEPVLRLTGTSNLGYAAGIQWQSGFGPKTSAEIFSTASGSQGGELWINVRDQTTNALERRMYFKNNGYIGIGTSAPGHKLEVNGGIRAGIAGNASANIPGLKVYAASASTSTTAAIAIQQGTSEGDTIIFADYEPHVEWGISAQNSTDQIHFTSGSSTNSLGSKTFYNNAGAARTAYIKFNHSLGDGRTLIGGNLGLGVTSATERLVVAGKVMINNANAPNNLAQLNIGWSGNGETRAIDIDGNWTTNENKSITFTHGSAATDIVGQINCQHTGPGSRIRWGKLHHSGNSSTYTMELISSSSTTADLTVLGNITSLKTTPQLVLEGRNSGNSGAAVQFLGWANTHKNWQLGNAVAGVGFQFRASTSAGNVNFATVATINSSTGAYTATSDINKKKDFEDSKIGLNEVMKLKPKLFRMKTENENSDKHLGFIAQEVKEVIPQAYLEENGKR